MYPSLPAELHRAISKWNSEAWARDQLGVSKVLPFLTDDEEDFEIQLTVDTPGPRPTLADLRGEFYSIDERVKLASLLAFQTEDSSSSRAALCFSITEITTGGLA